MLCTDAAAEGLDFQIAGIAVFLYGNPSACTVGSQTRRIRRLFQVEMHEKTDSRIPQYDNRDQIPPRSKKIELWDRRRTLDAFKRPFPMSCKAWLHVVFSQSRPSGRTDARVTTDFQRACWQVEGNGFQNRRSILLVAARISFLKTIWRHLKTSPSSRARRRPRPFG